FTIYEPMPDISGIFSLWDVTPHNTILWVWLRTGTVGFIVFWFLVGRGVIGASLTARHARDGYARAVGVFAVAATAGWLAMAYLDMGATNFRLTLLVGFLLGLAMRMTSMEGPPAPQAATQAVEAKTR